MNYIQVKTHAFDSLRRALDLHNLLREIKIKKEFQIVSKKGNIYIH